MYKRKCPQCKTIYSYKKKPKKEKIEVTPTVIGKVWGEVVKVNGLVFKCPVCKHRDEVSIDDKI